METMSWFQIMLLQVLAIAIVVGIATWVYFLVRALKEEREDKENKRLHAYYRNFNPFKNETYDTSARFPVATTIYVNEEIDKFERMVRKYVEIGAKVDEPLSGYGDLKNLILANLDSSADSILAGMHKRTLKKVSDIVLKSVAEKVEPLWAEQEKFQKIRSQFRQKHDSMFYMDIIWVYSRTKDLEKVIEDIKADFEELRRWFHYLGVETFPDISAYLALRLS